MAGRKEGNRSYRSPTDLGISIAMVQSRGDGDWRRLQDESYDKEDLENLKAIRADYAYEAELSPMPNYPNIKSEGGFGLESIIK